MKKRYNILLLVFVLCAICVSCSCNSGDVSPVSNTADTDYTALPGEPTNTPKIIIEIANQQTDVPEFTDAPPTEDPVLRYTVTAHADALYDIPFYRATDHFVIYSHEQDRDFSETMADILETFYREITRDLKYELSNKTEVIVYPTRDDMPISFKYFNPSPTYLHWNQLHIWSARDPENPFGISTIAPAANFDFAWLVIQEINPHATYFIVLGTAAYISGFNLDVFSEFKEYLDNNSLPRITTLFLMRDIWGLSRSLNVSVVLIAHSFVEYTVNGFGYGGLTELIKTGDREAVFGMDDERLHEAWTNFVRERYN